MTVNRSPARPMQQNEVSFRYFMIGASVVLLTWLAHELGHWLPSELLGYDTAMSLNRTYLLQGSYAQIWHSLLVSSAGPLVTLTQAAVAFALLRIRGWSGFAYLLLFTAFYMRLMASLINFINLNDEGRISSQLGLGTFTLPVLITGCLLALVYAISRQYRLRPAFQAYTVFTVMFWSSVLILSDQALPLRLL